MNSVKKLISALFIIMLITPMMFTFIEKLEGKEFPQECALKPLLTNLNSLQASEENFAKIDNCISENFGLREKFVYFNAFKDYYLFSSSSNPEVLAGKNKWLFLAETYQSPRLTEDETDQIAIYLKTLQDEFSRKGVKFLFVPVPDKKTIYPEQSLNNLEYFNTDNYQNLLISMNIYDVNHIDTKSMLLEQKATLPETDLYSKQDSHWNRYGAYLTYREILRALDLDTMTPNTNPTQYKREGDLARLLGIGGTELTPEIQTETATTQNNAQVYVFHDSFGLGLLPFFQKDFTILENLHVEDTYNDPNIIFQKAKNSKIVIFQIAERDLFFLIEKF